MTDDLGPDPLAPGEWGTGRAHAVASHVEGVQCRGSVALIDEAARLRGAARISRGRAAPPGREGGTAPARRAANRDRTEAGERDRRHQIGHELHSAHSAVDPRAVPVGLHGRHVHSDEAISDPHGVRDIHLDGWAPIGDDGATWIDAEDVGRRPGAPGLPRRPRQPTRVPGGP